MRPFRVTLLPSNQVFDVKPGELILDAALRQSVQVAYTCRNGTCRTCMFQVTEGIVNQEDEDQCLIRKVELENKMRLICMSTAGSDAVLTKPAPRQNRGNS